MDYFGLENLLPELSLSGSSRSLQSTSLTKSLPGLSSELIYSLWFGTLETFRVNSFPVQLTFAIRTSIVIVVVQKRKLRECSWPHKPIACCLLFFQGEEKHFLRSHKRATMRGEGAWSLQFGEHPLGKGAQASLKSAMFPVFNRAFFLKSIPVTARKWKAIQRTKCPSSPTRSSTKQNRCDLNFVFTQQENLPSGQLSSKGQFRVPKQGSMGTGFPSRTGCPVSVTWNGWTKKNHKELKISHSQQCRTYFAQQLSCFCNEKGSFRVSFALQFPGYSVLHGGNFSGTKESEYPPTHTHKTTEVTGTHFPEGLGSYSKINSVIFKSGQRKVRGLSR